MWAMFADVRSPGKSLFYIKESTLEYTSTFFFIHNWFAILAVIALYFWHVHRSYICRWAWADGKILWHTHCAYAWFFLTFSIFFEESSRNFDSLVFQWLFIFGMRTQQSVDNFEHAVSLCLEMWKECHLLLII